MYRNVRYEEPGKAPCVLGHAQDVTDRMQIERELRENRTLLEKAQEVAHLGHWVSSLALDGPLLWSGQACRVFGVDKDKFDGRVETFWSLVHPDDRDSLCQALTAALTGDQPYRIDHRIVRPDGEVRWVRERGEVVRDETGGPLKVIGVVQDITERRRAEAELRDAKEKAETASRVKSEFLATMSHELRTPLNIIVGYTALMLEGELGGLTGEQTEAMQRLSRSAHDLLDLVSAVLDLSALDAAQLPVERQVVNVPDLLREVAAETVSLRDESGLILEWHVDELLPPLHTDASKLKVIVKNLVGNAFKFTTAGGVTVTAGRADGGVEISVADTGVGMPADAIPDVFRPFRRLDSSSTSRYGGTGLGLNIVKRFLDLLGGSIRVESKLGSGSRFRVWLPGPETGASGTP